MAVLINALMLSDKNTGLGVYTYQMLQLICPMLNSDCIEYEILCKKAEYLPEICRDHIREIDFNGYFGRYFATKKIYKDNYDLIWSTTQHGVASSKVKQIITVHDLTPLVYPKGRWHQYLYYKFILPKLLKRCERVITVSQNTKEDILRQFKFIDPKKIIVSYSYVKNSYLNEYEDIKQVNEKYGIAQKKYFTITGIHYPYKNIHSVIKAYSVSSKLRGTKLVVIGNDKCSYGDSLKKLVKKFNLENNVIFTGFVSNAEKNTLLKNACATIYPSKYEGFGLPIVEAMQQGVPVLSSDASSLPEVGGDAALYFNPDNIDDIAEKLICILENDELRESLINKGYDNLKRFDSLEIAKRLYEELLPYMKNQGKR